MNTEEGKGMCQCGGCGCGKSQEPEETGAASMSASGEGQGAGHKHGQGHQHGHGQHHGGEGRHGHDHGHTHGHTHATWQLSLEELVAATKGRVLSQVERVFVGVGTDTRADLKGKLFVALKGDNFDAHDFLAKAVEAGAAALLVHRLPENARALLEKVTVVEVADTLVGLQHLGNFWRHKMAKAGQGQHGVRILGVTGTNGKTTTKEFAAAVLGSKFDVQYSKGSFNNHWGVPISLLSIAPEHEVAVIEMGMNHPGELTVLSRIAEPDAIVVTMVGRGHLEGMGSIEGVAKAKAEIYEHAPGHSIRIFNLENEHTRGMYERFGRSLPREQVIAFAGLEWARREGIALNTATGPLAMGGSASSGAGVSPAAETARTEANGGQAVRSATSSGGTLPPLDVALEVRGASPDSLRVGGFIRGVPGEVEVPVFGRQNVTNLMTAAAFALVCGMTPDEIWKALPLCKTAWGRNQWVDLQCGARVLFDAYNANPESMRAAVENFAGLTPPAGGRKIAVLGEMREMGDAASEVHRELASVVARAGFDVVCFLGPSQADFAAGIKSAAFSKTLFVSSAYEQNLASKMLPVLDRNDIVLIKGSRGMQLEKVLSDLKPVSFETKK